MKNEKVKITRRHDTAQSGQAMITAVVLLLFVSVAVMLGLGATVIKDIKITQDFVRSKQSYLTAESGVEDAAYRLKNGMQISATEIFGLNGATTTTTITDIGSEKEILATGDDTASSTRKVQMRLREAAVGASFNYGIQVGAGGLFMGQNAGVYGNVYVSGSIEGSGNGASMSFVTGTAIAANSIAVTADQVNDAPAVPSTNFTFGTSTPEDMAQSFTVSTTSPLNKISIYIKKTSTPANRTVYIMSDNAGVPGTVITSGTLDADLVTTTYGWIDVTFSENPELIMGATYWFALNGNNSATKYYTIGANANGYANGQLKKGTYNTTWNSTGGLDSYFKVYVGGMTATIDNVKIGLAGVGDAKAHNVEDSTIEGALYCQTGSGNNKACDTSQADPVPKSYAISQANIDQWKSDALAGGTIIGDYAPAGPVSIGPKHITGNFTIPKDETTTLTGTMWVEGTVTVENGAGNNTKVKLDSGYGSDSGVIVVDGKVDISNNVQFENSGTSGSFVLLLTTSDCPNGASCGGAPAINISNNVGAVLLDAPNGTLHFNNGSAATEATASKLELDNGATVTYNSGLADTSFSSGPGGSFDITKWREVQ
ncbi:MAG: hypothetical protein HYT94_05220 [Parcubacteria group bacterium]|nr:hypothetical protein [Parcubacteria group bacterium]